MVTPNAITKWLHDVELSLVAQQAKIDEVRAALRALMEYQQSQEPARSSSTKEEICSGAIEILSEHHRPQHRRDILAQLEAKGLYIGGRDPVANLGAILSRESVFYSAGAGEWGLTAWKTPSNGNVRTLSAESQFPSKQV